MSHLWLVCNEVRLVDPFAAKCPHGPEEAPGRAELHHPPEVYL